MKPKMRVILEMAIEDAVMSAIVEYFTFEDEDF